MGLTNAEKQRRYRERHLGPEGTKARLNLVVGADTTAQLKRLARHRGCTLTEMVEHLAADAERVAMARLAPTKRREYLSAEL
jgi:hypothetical protein